MVWPKFPPAKSSIVIDTAVEYKDLLFENGNHLTNCKTIFSHPFNQSLQLIIPNNMPDTPSDLNASVILSNIEDQEAIPEKYPNLNKIVTGFGIGGKNDNYNYFMIKNLPIHLLIHPVFVGHYVNTGNLYAVSIGTQIHLDDCIALSSGTLTLSLTDTTYRRLGLVGVKSMIVRAKKIVQKYIVTIDLCKITSTKKDTKCYPRTFSHLRNSNIKFDLLIKWEPAVGIYPPRSIFKFFEHMKNNPGLGDGYFLNESEASDLKINLCQPTIKRFSRYFVQAPKDLMENLEKEEKTQNSRLKPVIGRKNMDPKDISILDTINWIGGQFAGIEMAEVMIDPEITSLYLKQDETQLCREVNCYQISGFFSPVNVQCLICELQQLLITRLNAISGNEIIPFVSLIVNGFENTPVSWENPHNEHGSKVNGENLYGIVLKCNDDNMIWRIADEYDFGIEKL